MLSDIETRILVRDASTDPGTVRLVIENVLQPCRIGDAFKCAYAHVCFIGGTAFSHWADVLHTQRQAARYIIV